MKPHELAKALTSRPITEHRLKKFATHIHGSGNARKPQDESYARDTLNAIPDEAVREQARKALLGR